MRTESAHQSSKQYNPQRQDATAVGDRCSFVLVRVRLSKFCISKFSQIWLPLTIAWFHVNISFFLSKFGFLVPNLIITTPLLHCWLLPHSLSPHVKRTYMYINWLFMLYINRPIKKISRVLGMSWWDLACLNLLSTQLFWHVFVSILRTYHANYSLRLKITDLNLYKNLCKYMPLISEWRE